MATGCFLALFALAQVDTKVDMRSGSRKALWQLTGARFTRGVSFCPEIGNQVERQTQIHCQSQIIPTIDHLFHNK